MAEKEPVLCTATSQTLCGVEQRKDLENCLEFGPLLGAVCLIITHSVVDLSPFLGHDNNNIVHDSSV